MSFKTEDLIENNLVNLYGFEAKRGKAWHFDQAKQGAEPNHYPGAIPVEDVLRRLFHWQAVSAPMAAMVPTSSLDEMTGMNDDGSLYRTIVDPKRQAIVRPDTGAILGVFKDGYQIHQYDRWLLDEVANLLDQDLSIGTAGLLNGGGRAYVQVETPDGFRTPSGVEFIPYLLACTSHDGSLATTYTPTTTVVCCKNTLTFALKEGNAKVKVKHTRNSLLKLDSARQVLDIVFTTADDFTAEVEKMTNTVVTDDQFRAIIDAQFGQVFADSTARAKTMGANLRGTLLKMWNHDDRVTPWRGTAFGALQCLNTWAHHEQTVKGDRGARNENNTLDGTIADFDAKVLASIGRVLASA